MGGQGIHGQLAGPSGTVQEMGSKGGYSRSREEQGVQEAQSRIQTLVTSVPRALLRAEQGGSPASLAERQNLL